MIPTRYLVAVIAIALFLIALLPPDPALAASSAVLPPRQNAQVLIVAVYSLIVTATALAGGALVVSAVRNRTPRYRRTHQGR